MKKLTLTALSIAAILLSPLLVPMVASADSDRDWNGYGNRRQIIILNSRDRNNDRFDYGNRNYNRNSFNDNRNDYGRRRYYDDRSYRRYDDRRDRNFSNRPIFGINFRFGQ